MSKSLTERKVMEALDWSYGKAVNGLPGLGTAQQLGGDYLKGARTPRDAANSLIRWQNTKAATSGFVTNLGGIITLPVAIPANIASVMYVQIRMVAATAHIGGYDVNNDKVKTLCYACLTGNAAKDIVKEAGIKVGTKLSEQAIKSLSFEVIKSINKAVGFRLVTKFGQTGVVNLGKMIPFVGGVVGATFDGVSTNVIGNVARDTFTP